MEISRGESGAESLDADAVSAHFQMKNFAERGQERLCGAVRGAPLARRE
jgi:hypothetical protein